MARPWHYKIDLKSIIMNDALSLAETKEAMKAELEKCAPFQGHAILNKLTDCKTEDAVDKVLETVYDIADRERVWLGL